MWLLLKTTVLPFSVCHSYGPLIYHYNGTNISHVTCRDTWGSVQITVIVHPQLAEELTIFRSPGDGKWFKTNVCPELPHLAPFYLYFQSYLPLFIARSTPDRCFGPLLHPKSQIWNGPFLDIHAHAPSYRGGVEFLQPAKAWVFFPTCTPQGNSKSIISAIVHISAIKYLMHCSRNVNLIALKSVCCRRSWQPALLTGTTNWHQLYLQMNKSSSQVLPEAWV